MKEQAAVLANRLGSRCAKASASSSRQESEGSGETVPVARGDGKKPIITSNVQIRLEDITNLALLATVLKRSASDVPLEPLGSTGGKEKGGKRPGQGKKVGMEVLKSCKTSDEDDLLMMLPPKEVVEDQKPRGSIGGN